MALLASQARNPLTIALVFESKSEYLAQGYTKEECQELEEDETIDALIGTLQSLGHTAVRVGDIKSLVSCLASGEAQHWDLVFSTSEGLHGVAREAQVPALLEAYEIPFTGPYAATTVLCHDKAKTKIMLEHHLIPTAPFCVVPNTDDSMAMNGHVGRAANAIAKSRHSKALESYPLFAKPVAEGSSKGIQPHCKITKPSDLEPTVALICKRYPGQDILIETFLSGREFTVGILGTGSRARVLGVLEFRWRKLKRMLDRVEETAAIPGSNGTTSSLDEVDFRIMDWKSYLPWQEYVDVVSLDTDEDPEAQMACESALATWRALGCRDVGRIDVRSDKAGPGAVPHIIEVNPRPGFLPNRSDIIKIAKNAGLDYEDLIRGIVACASERIERREAKTEVKSDPNRITADMMESGEEKAISNGIQYGISATGVEGKEQNEGKSEVNGHSNGRV